MISFQFISRNVASKFKYVQIRQMNSGGYDIARQQQRNTRRKYAIVGCVTMMFFGSHAVLLWRRRSENRALNKETPPISFAEFERDYLLTGKIKSIVVHPHFQVCDAYTERKDLNPEKVGKTMLQSKTFFGQKFFYKPQVRFIFEEKPEVLEQHILEAQKTLEQPPEIHFEINKFPSYRELAFIAGSTIFGAACIGLMKF
uniref:Transmembrane protein n=1 Tax=Panagrolaimus sp. ES5 TaxID=591445 RepID=A0AC34F1K0_9BILA